MMRFKTWTVIAIALCIMSLSNSAWAQEEEKIQLNNLKDTLSYIIGHDLGQNFYKQSIEINPQILVDAIIIGMNKQASRFETDESNKILTDFVSKIRVQKADAMKQQGIVFLEENKNKEGVITTASGLQYMVLREGTGNKPLLEDQVMVHYKGILIDGTKFDASYDRGEPASFPVSGVIKGWTEGLQLMREGAKYRFFIPSELAYGEQGAGTSIPGGAVLIFDVELIKILVETPDTQK